MWPCKCPQLPLARKCCFCVPVRRAVIIFGYVNLVVWLLMFPMLVFMLAERATRGAGGGAGGGGGGGDDDTAGGGGGVQLPLTTACVLLDAAMTVVLLVGAHQKRVSFLMVYVWGGAGVQAVMLAMDVVFFDTRHPLLNAVFLLFLGCNMYLLYLVWSVAVRLRRAAAAPPPAAAPAPPAAPARSREWRYVMQPDSAPTSQPSHGSDKAQKMYLGALCQLEPSFNSHK